MNIKDALGEYNKLMDAHHLAVNAWFEPIHSKLMGASDGDLRIYHISFDRECMYFGVRGDHSDTSVEVSIRDNEMYFSVDRNYGPAKFNQRAVEFVKKQLTKGE